MSITGNDLAAKSRIKQITYDTKQYYPLCITNHECEPKVQTGQAYLYYLYCILLYHKSKQYVHVIVFTQRKITLRTVGYHFSSRLTATLILCPFISNFLCLCSKSMLMLGSEHADTEVTSLKKRNFPYSLRQKNPSNCHQ